MAEPTLDDVGKWILANQDKAGTPDFVQMSNAYRQMSVPDLAEVRKQPGWFNSVNNTIDRIGVGALTAIPDLAGAVYNAGARGLGYPGAQVGSLRESFLRNSGTPELPPDTSTLRRLSEAGASALLSGGAGGARAAIAEAPTLMQGAAGAGGALMRDVVAPTVASHYGGQAAESTLGKYMDPETANLIGSVIGGGAPAAAQAGGRAVTTGYYGQHAAPNAREVAAASDRIGVTPTPGMVGDQSVRNAEMKLEAKPGSASIIQGRRDQAADQMVTAAEVAASQRGRPLGGPSVVGDVASQTARDTVDYARQASAQAQQRLMDRIGRDTPVPVQSVFDRGYGMMTDPEISVPTAQAIDRRLTGQLAPRINRDAAGSPIYDQGGSPTVPYGSVKAFRSDLGRSFDQGSTPPATKELYGPVTAAMEQTSNAQGVPVQDFRNVQGRTRAVEGEGGVAQTLDEVGGREPQAAYNYLLPGGEKNPERLTSFEAATTGDPRTGDIMASHIQNMIDETIGRGGARGHENFARRIETMHPEALDVIGGAQAPVLQDVATAARAYDRPTSTTGLTRQMRNVTAGQSEDAAAAVAAYLAGKLKGAAGAAITAGIPRALQSAQARVLTSPSAMRGMTGGPVMGRYLAPDMSQLVSALTAAEAQRDGVSR